MTHAFTFIYAIVLGYMINDFDNDRTILSWIKCIFWPLLALFELLGYLKSFLVKHIPLLDISISWTRWVLLHRFFKFENISYLEAYVKKYSSDEKFWNRKRAKVVKKILQLNQPK